MVGTTNHGGAESTDKCPENPDRRGPDTHGVERVEQPDDMDAFFVARCMWCGEVFDRYDTEQEYLSNEFPEIHGDN